MTVYQDGLVIYRGPDERLARRAAASALGAVTLRGLAQVPTVRGVLVYARAADDYRGRTVEIVW